MPDGQRDQPKAGIGNSGHTSIGDQRHACALLQIFNQLSRTRHLIVFVVADGAGCDVVVVQQFLSLPRVFAGDDVHFFEHAQGTQRDVLQVADGGTDKVKRRPWTERARIVLWRKGFCLDVFGFVNVSASVLHGRSLPLQP